MSKNEFFLFAILFKDYFKDYLIKFFAFNSKQLKLYGYRKDVYKIFGNKVL